MAGLQFNSSLPTSLTGEIVDLDTAWDGAQTVLALTGRYGVELWLIGGNVPQHITTVDVLPAPGSRPQTQLSHDAASVHLLISGGYKGGSTSVVIDKSDWTQTQTQLGGTNRHATALRKDVFGTETIVAAPVGASGLSLRGMAPDGSLTEHQRLSDADAEKIGQISEMESLTINGREFVIVLSTISDTVSVVELARGGTAGVTTTLSIANGIPISDPVSVTIAAVGSTYFAIVGSAKTSSLTVFEIQENGALTLTDYVTDTLHTRFDGTPALTSHSGGTLAHVLAGGADDGISLMALTPEGRLIHVETIPDTAQTALDGVTSLGLAETDTSLLIFAADQTGGVSQFSLNPIGDGGALVAAGDGSALVGGPGDDVLFGSDEGEVLSGAGGDDLLMDAGGQDTLSGGSGADTFIFVNDGQTDRITDFDPSEDQLDLTAYSSGSKTALWDIAGSATQMTLTVDSDTLIMTASAGASLSVDTIVAAVAMSFDRPDLPEQSRTVTGSQGADTLLGAAFSDTLDGSGGDDLILGASGADLLKGGTGDDVLLGDESDVFAPEDTFEPAPFLDFF